MPYDKGLAERLEELLSEHDGVQPRTMFGGLVWQLNGNICLGIYRDFLIIRIGADAAMSVLAEDHVKPMDITGRPMKGWLMVAPEGLAEDAALRRYAALALDFVRGLPDK